MVSVPKKASVSEGESTGSGSYNSNLGQVEASSETDTGTPPAAIDLGAEEKYREISVPLEYTFLTHHPRSGFETGARLVAELPKGYDNTLELLLKINPIEKSGMFAVEKPLHLPSSLNVSEALQRPFIWFRIEGESNGDLNIMLAKTAFAGLGLKLGRLLTLKAGMGIGALSTRDIDGTPTIKPIRGRIEYAGKKIKFTAFATFINSKGVDPNSVSSGGGISASDESQVKWYNYGGSIQGILTKRIPNLEYVVNVENTQYQLNQTNLRTVSASNGTFNFNQVDHLQNVNELGLKVGFVYNFAPAYMKAEAKRREQILHPAEHPIEPKKKRETKKDQKNEEHSSEVDIRSLPAGDVSVINYTNETVRFDFSTDMDFSMYQSVFVKRCKIAQIQVCDGYKSIVSHGQKVYIRFSNLSTIKPKVVSYEVKSMGEVQFIKVKGRKKDGIDLRTM